MALGDILGSFGLGNINIDGIINSIFHFIGIFLVILVLGGSLTAFLIIRKRKKNKAETFKIGWWKEVGEEMKTAKVQDFEEVVLPGSMLRIFYNKENDLWVPRFTRGVNGVDNLFYVLLTPTNQMVNFAMPSLSADLKRANIIYDHTDMLWAAENSREYIKRNYKDKAVKWWQLYQNTIATAAIIIVFTFCMVLIIYFMKGIVSQLGDVVGSVAELLKQANAAKATSGIVTAG